MEQHGGSGEGTGEGGESEGLYCFSYMEPEVRVLYSQPLGLNAYVTQTLCMMLLFCSGLSKQL